MMHDLELRFNVHGFDCGYGGQLRMFSLANYFQEAAGMHASLLGIGSEHLHAHGFTWMLSRIDLKVGTLPQQGEEVLVRTWPAGNRRLFAQRCIELIDAGGMRQAGALYDYIIVDIERRMPVRPEHHLPQNLRLDRPLPYPDLETGIPPSDFGDPEGFEPVMTLTAGGRHIDHNGHVNNAHFFNWVCEAIPGYPEIQPCRIRLDFVHEILRGQTIEIRRACIDYEGKRWRAVILADGMLAARALLELKE